MLITGGLKITATAWEQHGSGMVHFWRRFRRKPNGRQLLTFACVVILLALALPWPLALSDILGGSFFGIPTGYFLVTLAFPFVMLLITFWYSVLVSETEPFDSKDT